MATSTTTKIDIPLMVWRLAPKGEFHWKGNGYGTYADIGEWRSPEITKPTEGAVYAEWDVYQAEQAQAATDAATLRALVVSLANSAVGIRIDALIAIQVRALAAILFWEAGAINPDGTIRPLAQWVK